MRNVSLRRRLFLLAAAAIVPLATMSGLGLLVLAQEQRLQAERASLDVSRALATAVDAELNRAVSVLEALATSLTLDHGDTAGFYERATRVMATRPYWRTVLLADPTGAVLLDTGFPYGSTLPPLAERSSFDTVVRTGRPAVGALGRGPGGEFALPVRVPVERDGRLRYVLTGVIKPQAILQVINRQRVPADWVVSVFDGRGLRVARSRAHEKFIGTPATASLQELMGSGAAEGVGVTTVLEGDEALTAFTRLNNGGWTVAIGVPMAEVDAAAYRSVAAYGGGMLLSIVLGTLAALGVAGSINQPMRDLRRAAQALGRGEPPPRPASDIREIQEVADALIASAEQRARVQAEAEVARQQAETANRVKDEFLAMLGHELRNPLAPIVTALHLMARRNDQASAAERRVIERQVAHLRRLVDDLLDVSRITQGKVTLQRERVDMKAVLARALEQTQPLLDKRERAVEVELPDEPVSVHGDAVRLAQVFANLLTNAAKFTPGDGCIALRLRRVGSTVEVVVEDDGSGITPELLPHVFDLFKQGEQTIDRNAGGLGLGLAIVKTLVQMHGGSVSAASRGPAQGSIFVVRLPAADGRGAGPDERSERAPVARCSGRILVVDDNADAAETLALLLREVGYEVQTASDAAAALATLDRFVPDLAMLDIGLPGIDGYELARRLRADVRGATLRLVALTGYGREPDRLRALAAQFDEHLVKPVAPERLFEAVARLLAAPR